MDREPAAGLGRRVAPTTGPPWGRPVPPPTPQGGMELGAAAQLCWQGCQSRSTEAEYRSCLRRFCRFAQRRG
ncbi:MAG: hypothetical protein ACRENX_09665, partial [Candidatus Dormibacteria bacterium]